MLRVIGDIHDEIDVYLKLIADCNQSLQLGDFAREFGFLNGVSPKHKFFGGNHDHYPNMMAWSGGHHLGHFGSVEFDDFGAIFFVRGGSSVDASCRCIGRNWWAEEQLSWAQALEAVKCYQAVKPDILISHECPSNIVPYVTDPAFMERFHLGNSIVRLGTAWWPWRSVRYPAPSARPLVCQISDGGPRRGGRSHEIAARCGATAASPASTATRTISRPWKPISWHFPGW